MATIRLFRHHVRLPFFMLALVEMLVLVGGVLGAVLLCSSDDSGIVRGSVRWLMPRTIAYVAVMMLCLVAMNLYQARLRKGIFGILLRISAGFLVGAVTLPLLYYLVPNLLLPQGALVRAMLISFAGVCASRAAFYALMDRNLLHHRVLVLGAGAKAASVLGQMRRHSDQMGFTVVGFVPVRGELETVDASKIVRCETSLLDCAEAHGIDEIMVAVDDRRQQLPLHELLDCKMSGIQVIDVVTFFERMIGKIRLDLLSPSWMIFSEGFGRHPLSSHSKRLLDIVAAATIAAASWPLMLLACLAIRIEDGWRSPVLYRQVRVGQDGRPFELLKFRSMHVGAEQDDEVLWAAENDSRITRVGAVLRKYRIDELPQLLNILRGDMSLVGPRPERPEHIARLVEAIPYYAERHRVKPGLTGWAQLCYRYGASEEDAMEKLQYDLYYVKNHGLFLDLIILLQTAEVILFSKGVR